MPIFDVTAPADGTKAGLGAKVFREEIKTLFNTKFEAKVVEVIATLWECVKGWPRIYSQAAAPTPPAGAEVGRCWLDTDDDSFWVHDGTVWNRIGPDAIDIRIPLFYGPGFRLKNAAYGGSYHRAAYYLNWDTQLWDQAHWAAGEGIPFNKAYVPAGATIKLGIVGGSQAAGQAKVKIYDMTAGADVAGSETALTGGELTAKEAFSGDLTAAITAGDRKLRLMSMAGTATSYTLLAAYLRIQKA